MISRSGWQGSGISSSNDLLSEHLLEPSTTRREAEAANVDLQLRRDGKGSLPRLLVHTAGIVSTYTIYGFLLERITSTRHGLLGERFDTFFVLIFCACAFNALVAYVALRLRPQDNTAYVPQYNFMLVSLSYVGAMYGSSTALKFVSFPTQVLAKSCKMIPVMVMGLVLGKRYTQTKYMCVGVITAGVFLFMMKPQKAVADQKDDTFMGIVLLLFSLLCDGFTSAFEEKVVSVWNPSTLQMMLNTNAYGAFLVFVGALLHGEISRSAIFFYKYPSTLLHLLVFATAGAAGQMFIFNTIREFGALVTSTATTMRKFLNVVWSVFWFGHIVTGTHLLGGAMVFGGLLLDLHARYSRDLSLSSPARSPGKMPQ